MKVFILFIGSILTLTTFSVPSLTRPLTDTIIPEKILDTGEIKRIVEARIDKIVEKKVQTIDSIKHELIDTIRETPLQSPKSVKKRWRRFVDLEHRPDGHIFRWTWWYIISRTRYGTDTTWDGMEIKLIR